MNRRQVEGGRCEDLPAEGERRAVLRPADELLARTSKAKQILEIEVGVVGGEEDGVSAEINDKLYTTVEDGMRTIEVLGLGEKGRYMTALTFGNVHGVYKPGSVKLRPAVLKAVSYTHLRAHETVLDLVCRLLLEKKKTHNTQNTNRQRLTPKCTYYTKLHLTAHTLRY